MQGADPSFFLSTRGLRENGAETSKKSSGEPPVETAPRNCRFLSLVVVERFASVLLHVYIFLNLNLTSPKRGWGPEGWNPLRGHPEKQDLLALGASEWPTFFSRFVEDECTSLRAFLGQGQTKWDKQVSAKFCGFLRVSCCGFLRKSAPPKCCNSQEKRKSAKNQRKSAKKTANSAPFVPFSLSL